MRKQDLQKMAEWLRRADAEGLEVARREFVKTPRCMCPLSAIYYEATRQIPSWWNNEERSDAVKGDLRTVTGMDFSDLLPGSHVSFYGYIVRCADGYGWGFIRVAEELEKLANDL